MRMRAGTLHRFIVRRMAILAIAMATATGALALEVPPPPDRWFTDRAGIVSPTEEDLLNRKLQDFEQSSGAQFIIYVLPSLEGESLEDFTIRAVERWKVGQKKYDNGLVLFVFVKEQRVRVEVGYGLEGSITDAFASRVIRNHIAPAFEQQQYAQGLSAAADAIIAQIRSGEAPVEPLNPRGSGAQGTRGEDIGIIPVLFILFFVFFVLAPMLGGRRGRRSGCGGCMFPFFFFPGGGITLGGGGFGGGGFGGGGFGGGGFSGGGGGFGGGGASGGW